MSATSPTKPNPSLEEPAASRLGLTLFALYTSFYLGFVFLNAFAADSMETVVFAGLNLAIVYGFGLILVAILMAFVYGFALRDNSGSDSGSDPGRDSQSESSSTSAVTGESK